MVESHNGWENQPRNGGQFGRKETTKLLIANQNPITGQVIKSKNTNPWFKAKQQYDDFATYFLPTDDIWGSSGQGEDTIPALQYFEWLAERRIGVAWKIARKPAEDAIRNRFTIRDFSGEEVQDDDILDWMEDTDFYNQLVQALYFERVYGTSFLMKYFTENDRENQNFETEVKKGKRPIAFQAFPPTVMTPTNVHKTFWLDTDPQKWELSGGQYNSQKIDPSRVHVFMTRPTAHRWRGISVFEPIWIPLMSYFQAQIFMLRAFSEMGNVIPAWLIETEDDQYEIMNVYADLLDEMKMNGKYVGKKGDEFKFENTHIGDGLQNLMEIWKEDISAGSNIPMPILFGRVTAAGMSGAAYLMAERYYWNEVSNIQAGISDDVIRIIREAGFKTIDKKKRIDWNLAITKTDQQRLLDEGMQIQNEILKEDLIQRQLQTAMMMKQFELGLKKPEQFNAETMEPEPTQQEQSNQQKRDFVIEKILEERSKLNKYMWGARKVA